MAPGAEGAPGERPARRWSGYPQRDGEPAEAYARRLLELLDARDRELSLLRGGRPPAEAGDEARGAEGGGDGGGHEGGPGVAGGAASGGDGGDLTAAEALLARQSQASQPPGVQQLLESLQAAAVYTDAPNHETNRKLWDAYARSWSADQDWVVRMASHLPGGCPRDLRCVGDEWSDDSSLSAVLDDWVFPHVDSAARTAEIGSGGGRVAAHVAGRVRELVCFDISREMLRAARQHLETRGCQNVRFEEVAGEGEYPPKHHGTFDFVYSFDVFVHMDLHQMRRTLQCARALLRPGGLLFVSFANLLAPGGWRRFSRQQHYSVGGFYFVSPDIANCLVQRSGFHVERVSRPAAGNIYLDRDLLVLARRPPAGGADPAGAAD